MQIIIFFPALILFLYALYRIVKDDHVFIRKGISLEQSFDIAFITLWASLFMSRFIYLLFHMYVGENLLFDFFTITKGGFSLTGAILGGMITVYFVGSYKRLPLGRLSDSLSLSFLYALPLVFLSNAIFASKNELLFVFLNSIIYFVLLLFFVQFLYPKILNRTIKEGKIAMLFLLCFSLIALITSLLVSLKHIQSFINPENITLIMLFITSIILLMKQERASSTTRRTFINK
ncbi:MAG TPA: prolipoprotein diacylglyceryl transferase family protein [Candidatus Sulfotelmatobacter sp.]|jgi:prolipoprotein diacylglyceryltransferase|nr:prolipoprotein diacylglyceryl transferase family protein [Candidatus Sulfotelmatobacter sp.]